MWNIKTNNNNNLILYVMISIECNFCSFIAALWGYKRVNRNTCLYEALLCAKCASVKSFTRKKKPNKNYKRLQKSD